MSTGSRLRLCARLTHLGQIGGEARLPTWGCETGLCLAGPKLASHDAPGRLRNAEGLGAEAERRVFVRDEGERVRDDAVVPAGHALHELEEAARVATCEEDREPREDHDEERRDAHEEEQDVV